MRRNGQKGEREGKFNCFKDLRNCVLQANPKPFTMILLPHYPALLVFFKFETIIVRGKVVAQIIAQYLSFYYQKANDF